MGIQAENDKFIMGISVGNHGLVDIHPVPTPTKIELLAKSEINFEICAYFDHGFTAKLGDLINSYVSVKTFDTFSEAVNFLWEEAQKHYPDAKCFFNDEEETIDEKSSPLHAEDI